MVRPLASECENTQLFHGETGCSVSLVVVAKVVNTASRVFDLGVLGQVAKYLKNELIGPLERLPVHTELLLPAPARKQHEPVLRQRQERALDVLEADGSVPPERPHLPKTRLEDLNPCLQTIGGRRDHRSASWNLLEKGLPGKEGAGTGYLNSEHQERPSSRE
jgi:hypothetical protein